MSRLGKYFDNSPGFLNNQQGLPSGRDFWGSIITAEGLADSCTSGDIREVRLQASIKGSSNPIIASRVSSNFTPK
jgi:hypothetical protein